MGRLAPDLPELEIKLKVVWHRLSAFSTLFLESYCSNEFVDFCRNPKIVIGFGDCWELFDAFEANVKLEANGALRRSQSLALGGNIFSFSLLIFLSGEWDGFEDFTRFPCNSSNSSSE